MDAPSGLQFGIPIIPPVYAALRRPRQFLAMCGRARSRPRIGHFRSQRTTVAVLLAVGVRKVPEAATALTSAKIPLRVTVSAAWGGSRRAENYRRFYHLPGQGARSARR